MGKGEQGETDEGSVAREMDEGGVVFELGVFTTGDVRIAGITTASFHLDRCPGRGPAK